MSNNSNNIKLLSSNTNAGGNSFFASVGSQISWSTIPAISDVNMNNYNIINLNKIEDANEISVAHLISPLIDGKTISLQNQDNQNINVLEAINGDLFFNAELLAKANDIQDIADWANYPALFNINMNGKSITNTTSDLNISNSDIAGNLVLSSANNLSLTSANDLIISLNSSVGAAGELLGSDGAGHVVWTVPTAAGVTSLNTLNGAITVSSTNAATLGVAQVGQDIQLTVPASAVGVTSFQTLTGAVGLTSTGGSVGITTVGQNINLETLGITPVSDWANFPAGNSVNLPDKNLNMTTSTPGIAYSKATLNADVDIGSLSNAPLRPDLNAYCGTVTFGGITTPLTAMNINSLGPVSVNSVLGVSIAGGGGVAVTGGGAVNVNSVGGVLVDGGGAISINGAGGISIVGGGALSIASGGILVSAGGVAINGGGVAINAGGLSVAAGATAIGSAGLAGGGLNVYGSDLSLLPVGAFTSSLKTDLITSQSGTPTLAISNVATINGAPYPPGGGGVDLNGLLNKINAFPALPYTTSSSSTPATNQTATAIVPDATPPVNVPTVGAVQGGWGFSKPALNPATFNWYMYNPRFGAPSAPLPYIKSKIQSAWALIRPTVNLYSAGYLGLNLYTFDDANPPQAPLSTNFYNTRWAYSNSSGVVAGATGVNLFAGYTYLIYANDVPRITNGSAIGVPDSQISGLRDPYDIYTDVNHIALSNCVVAFNPWTNGTNYQTWTPTGVYTINNTVVFAGFGTNYNGLFFIATGTPAVGVTPMVSGVVSANWALISPQPSSFADQPVSLININQSSAAAQAVGYVVLDIGFSYGPSTTSTTVSQHISLLPN